MIHGDHPFQTPPADRDPVRQFRGRLVAPVTLVTAGGLGSEAALTVSSLVVAEGDPASVVMLIGPATDLAERIELTERFIVHILDSSHREDADAFAGIRPRPGGPFHGVAFEHTDWGPAVAGAANRLYCRLASVTGLPFHNLVQGTIEQVEVGELHDPAVYFRGEHRKLAP